MRPEFELYIRNGDTLGNHGGRRVNVIGNGEVSEEGERERQKSQVIRLGTFPSNVRKRNQQKESEPSFE